MFFILDRVLKNIAFKSNESFNLLGDILIFNFTKNYNISFSLPISGPALNYTILFILLAIVGFTIYLLTKKKEEKSSKLYAILLFALFLGALSNYIDRLSLGYVIDYFQFKNFSVFNLADALISVSAFSIILLNFRAEKRNTALKNQE
ncbi:MAG: signal peptidase II [Patescibacteria group bacterium]|nr:signal peptidase II [Patescibacteria group bacterium]